jgi:hypothetical protein
MWQKLEKSGENCKMGGEKNKFIGFSQGFNDSISARVV